MLKTKTVGIGMYLMALGAKTLIVGHLEIIGVLPKGVIR